MGIAVEKVVHWFTYKDSCVSVVESSPARTEGVHSPTLFFLHGRFGQAESWNAITEALSNQFRCITLDFPGSGSSVLPRGHPFTLLENASLVTDLIRHFTLLSDEVVLIGHDVGGCIAQLSALKCLEKVVGLVLIDSADLIGEPAKIRSGFYGWMAWQKLRGLLFESNRMTSEDQKSLCYPLENRVSRTAFLKSIQALERSWPGHYERQSWKAAIKKCDRPVLLLWGKNDSLNPPALGVKLFHWLPEGGFFIHERAGHWPHLEYPQWVTSKMKDFIFKLTSKPVQKSLLQ